ncbi:MAG: 2-dehydropantoate 2-reductase [Rhizobiaceae bacterium]
MRIAIIGVGAMGSVYAGLLAEAGNEVWAVDTWPEHLDAIAKNGLRLEGPSGDRVIRGINATSSLGDAGQCDLYVIATKASAVGVAAQSIARTAGPDSLVLTIQNGLGSGERIAGHLPGEMVLLGVADGFGASMKAPGHAHHNSMKLIRLGEMQGGISQRLTQVESVWRDAGFNVKAFEDINQLIWEKFICNVTFSAACAVFECTVGELMGDPVKWEIGLGAMREAHAIGCRQQIAFGFPDAEAYVTAFGASMPGARPSMLLDHMAGRASEIDAINGIVPELGRQHGIATPYNTTLSALVRHREQQFSGSGRK